MIKTYTLPDLRIALQQYLATLDHKERLEYYLTERDYASDELHKFLDHLPTLETP